jgi:hypothetical protein
MAMAKLILTMPKPVSVLRGPTYRPIDWRVPMVIIKIEDAMIVVIQTPGWFMLGKSFMLDL